MSKNTSRNCYSYKDFIALIAEKPKAAEKIALALGSYGKLEKCRYYKVPYYVIRSDGRTILILPSAGHLFGPSTTGRGVPIVKIVWKPLWEFDKAAYYTKTYYMMMSSILPNAGSYINACDFDIEGSVIGYKIIESFGDVKKAKRMKYSTLTKNDIIDAFNKLSPLDLENVNAGYARHELDWLWGINVSRLLMKSFKNETNKSISLSAGRVQSPTLAEAIRRWIEINLYLPKPFLSILILGEYDGKRFLITPKNWSPKTISEAKEIKKFLEKNPVLNVDDYQESKEKVPPPPAFNLGDLQKESSRIYGFSPFKTQSIAEELYLETLISYPRTNSQKLPKTINYKQIINDLSKQSYKNLIDTLLKETQGKLNPVQGREDDPAHPAIYPTGEVPKKIYGDYLKIYDLIVRRFLSAFSKEAILGKSYVTLSDNENRKYKAEGLVVMEEGWLKYYTFSYPKINEIPVLRKNDKVKIIKVDLKTIWPKINVSLSRTSLLRWMERVNIGTEATRARIIELLYKRKYLINKGRNTEITNLGYAVYKAIELVSKELISPELTRNFEEKLDLISKGKYTKDEIVNEAKEFLTKIIKEKLNDKSIGKSLAIALGIEKPEEMCYICKREAKHKVLNYSLCDFHFMALSKIKENIADLVNILEDNDVNILKELSENKSIGLWIRETSKFLINNDIKIQNLKV
ncbi:DNA topoisomerase I, archaeal [Caldisphaera lagunensis DSM 15908]|uniref:DNA topoisomerase n=1 Tax=Caldisphaera lagunensis (strain DSM 15908 / JCM 11604 / ANMR 0165 / IC-154) TaxID=1056495 RepID=L0AAM6_CALLD|nr:DNA topoisomerase I [Caldisphaera lagunensis]AFZ70936.1 DNA topoisomerase I, archaeal [Caldisphaera lagunensis DSM 15908]